MKQNISGLNRFVRRVSIFALALGMCLITTVFLGVQTAHALPEYAARTGEPCATCHVSPGGGGPRTLRGLLWAARGKPDKVPTLPGILIAPGVSDGAELFDIICAACHGSKGEGLFAIGLVGKSLDAHNVQTFVENGIPLNGMPSFKGQLTDDQLTALVTFVTGLSNGQIAPSPDEYVLPPALFGCAAQSAAPDKSCSQRTYMSRGN
jgi:mono/diheme cytochrome c family protein